MRSKGRVESNNIEDLRSYFGTDALDTDYPTEDRYADFVHDGILAPYITDKPRTFSKNYKVRYSVPGGMRSVTK